MDTPLWSLDDYTLRERAAHAQLEVAIANSKVAKLANAVFVINRRIALAIENPGQYSVGRLTYLRTTTDRALQMAELELRALRSVLGDMVGELARRDPPRWSRAERERIDRQRDLYVASPERNRRGL
jgi:hypothetical protein